MTAEPTAISVDLLARACGGDAATDQCNFNGNTQFSASMARLSTDLVKRDVSPYELRAAITRADAAATARTTRCMETIEPLRKILTPAELTAVIDKTL